MTRLAMEVVHDDPLLVVERFPGEGRRVVVAISGVGSGFGGVQQVEFVATASDHGRNTVLFVKDRTRSWFTADGIVARIADAVRGELDRAGLLACVTLGNSLGGYGAVRLCPEVPVATAMAFSPQASMDPGLIDEPRWAEHRPAIVLARHLPLSACLVPGSRVYAVFGAAIRRERAHRALLPPDGPDLRCLMLPGAGHNVVQVLKGLGLLSRLVAAMMDHDDVAVAAIEAEYRDRVPGGAPGAADDAALAAP